MTSKPVDQLRSLALEYPEAEEAVACNKSAFKARNKSFMFVGFDDQSYNVMLKLRDSLEAAAALASQSPDSYKVGAHGWVTATFRHGQTPPPGLLEKWIEESYQLLVPRKVSPARQTKKVRPKKKQ